MTYEYDLVPLVAAPTKLAAGGVSLVDLTDAGQEGWSAVCSVQLPDGSVAILVQRPIETEVHEVVGWDGTTGLLADVVDRTGAA